VALISAPPIERCAIGPSLAAGCRVDLEKMWLRSYVFGNDAQVEPDKEMRSSF